jgi:hypothetical protein
MNIPYEVVKDNFGHIIYCSFFEDRIKVVADNVNQAFRFLFDSGQYLFKQQQAGIKND